jgi:hypothetical protein
MYTYVYVFFAGELYQFPVGDSNISSQAWWCTFVILATWRQTRGSQFETSQGKRKKKKKSVRSYLKNKPGVVEHACNPCYLGVKCRRTNV